MANFFFIDSDETRTMHTKSDNLEIMMGNETDEIIEDLFESFLQKYQEWLEESMRGSEFAYEVIVYRFPQMDKKQKGNNKTKK